MTRDELKKYQKTADELRLIGREFLHMPKRFILDNCNGIGPEWFPKKWRNFVTKVCPSFVITAAIHDLMWSCGYDFERSNDILALNGKWEAKYNYQWHDPRRYLAIWRARKFAQLCMKYGYLAWKQAQRKAKR